MMKTLNVDNGFFLMHGLNAIHNSFCQCFYGSNMAFLCDDMLEFFFDRRL